MFSWIIEKKAKIISREGWLFRVENSFPKAELSLGQSIAHDGACMTLTRIEDDFYEFFMMEESLRVTHFSAKKPGDTLNVERCITPNMRLDGHIVTGHIDTVWKVIQSEKKQDGSMLLSLSFDPRYVPLVIEKGSIALSGVSLTVVTCTDDALTVSLIPLTQEWTNLWNLEKWDEVNIEFDQMGKYIVKTLEKYLQSQK